MTHGWMGEAHVTLSVQSDKTCYELQRSWAKLLSHLASTLLRGSSLASITGLLAIRPLRASMWCHTDTDTNTCLHSLYGLAYRELSVTLLWSINSWVLYTETYNVFSLVFLSFLLPRVCLIQKLMKQIFLCDDNIPCSHTYIILSALVKSFAIYLWAG